MRILICLLCCAAVQAQVWRPSMRGVMSGSGCGTPTGTTLTESFGEGRQACSDGTNGCTNQLWARGAGTADAIVASPGTPAPNTACGKSLHMNQGSAAAWIANQGMMPLIPAGSVVRWGGTLNWHSDSIANYSSGLIASLSASPGSSTYSACEMTLNNNNGPRRLRGRNNGGSSSYTLGIVIAADTWYKWAMQCDTSGMANNSCFSDTADLSCCGTGADTAHCQRFTAASDRSPFAVSVGNTNSVAMQYYLGNLWVDSNAGNTAGDSMIMRFTSGNDGDALVVANATTATTKGNGTWGAPGGSGFTISNHDLGSLNTPVNVAGTNYSGDEALSVKYDHASNANYSLSYAFASYSNTATTCFTWATTRMTQYENASFNAIQNVLGTDFVSLMFNSGQVYLETLTNPNGNPDVGSKYSYATDTVYRTCMQFNVGGPHKMWLWDASCNLLSYQEKAAVNGATSRPTKVSYARADNNGAFSGFTYFKHLRMNYKGDAPACH